VMGTQTWQVERTKKKINDLPTLFPVPWDQIISTVYPVYNSLSTLFIIFLSSFSTSNYSFYSYLAISLLVFFFIFLLLFFHLFPFMGRIKIFIE
jgi:hypothetical protein